MKKILTLLSAVSIASFAYGWTGANGTELVDVGDAGNAAYASSGLSNGSGSVDYAYSIGAKEVTVSQYLRFVNSVLKDVTHEEGSSWIYLNVGGVEVALYSAYNNFSRGQITFNADTGMYEASAGKDDYAINAVSGYAAAMYTNWLTNGATAGSSYLTGFYDFEEYGVSMDAIANAGRDGQVSGYALPTMDEWFKAAYYDGEGGYWKYATQRNDAPTASAPTDAPNSANYDGAASNRFTETGAYKGSESHYGTFDQNGNVPEILQTQLPGKPRYLIYAGGSILDDVTGIGADPALYDSGEGEDAPTHLGFRVVYIDIPEPSTAAALLGVLALGFAAYRRRK